MPRASVTHRLRARLRTLLQHGDQTALERWSHRPGGTKISQQELSYFLNDKQGRRGLTIDDLDDLSSFFKLTIGELLGDTKESELTGSEQRMVRAFRVLPESHQDHVLALVESAAVTYKFLPPPSNAGIRRAQLQPIGRDSHGPPRVPADAAEMSASSSAELRHLREFLSRVVYQLTLAATGAVPDESLPGVGAEKA